MSPNDLPPDDRAQQGEKKGVSVRVESCPKEGTIVVLFLSPIDGILTHWSRKGSVPCPGVQDCPSSLHKDIGIWKGYASAMWLQRNHETNSRAWVPCVFEVTEKALEEIGVEVNPVNCIFKLERRRSRTGKSEVSAEVYKTGVQHEHKVFPYRPVVERMYHTRAIRWGVLPDVPPPVYAEVVPVPN